MRTFKDLVVLGAGLAAAVYLVYPSFSLFELIPDAVPFVGSIDEATATVVLVSAFRYYGVDLSRLFQRDDTPDPTDDKRRLPPPQD
jgi:uncharacterized membrane protein YkvA (DUF1232 family)